MSMERSLATLRKTPPGPRSQSPFFLMRSATALLRSTLLLAARPRTLCVTAAAAPPKRVVFLGTPNVAARSLELILQGAQDGRGGGFEVAAVVSQPPAKTGRKMKLTPSPVHVLAEEKGVKLFTPPNAKDEEFLSALEALEPDLCITAAYGCFLPQRFLDTPKLGTLNIHPSLLPLYRGAAPVQRSLENGDAVTGVSVAFTVLAMDAGPLVRQVERPLNGDEQAGELLNELFETGTDLLLDALPSVWDGSCGATMVQQDGERATKAPKIKNEEAEVRLDELGAASVHHRVRGFSISPGVWTEFDLGDAKPPVRVKLLKTAIVDGGGAPTGGTSSGREIALNGKRLELTCSDSSILGVSELTLPGKKPTNAKSFWNGLNKRTATWVGADQKPPTSDAPPKAKAAPKAKEAPATASGDNEAPPPDGFIWGITL